MKYSLPKDTSRRAAAVQYAILRKKTLAERAEMTLSLNRMLRRNLIVGIRHRHPDYTDQQIRRELFRILHGEKLCKEVYDYKNKLKEKSQEIDSENNEKNMQSGGENV